MEACPLCPGLWGALEDEWEAVLCLSGHGGGGGRIPTLLLSLKGCGERLQLWPTVLSKVRGPWTPKLELTDNRLTNISSGTVLFRPSALL